MTVVSQSSWYVVQTHPKAESKGAWHLSRQGYDVYLPQYMKSTRHARRVRTSLAPLFPRYLFVGLDAMVKRWRPIQSTFGVTHLVCNGDRPAMVPESLIADLKSREDERGSIRLNQRPKFLPGDKIRVIEGVFVDSIGLFEGMADRDRVAVLLDLLGRKARVIIGEGAVVAV